MVQFFEPALRPLFGKILANVPSRKITARIAISVISTVVFVIRFPVLRPGTALMSSSLFPGP